MTRSVDAHLRMARTLRALAELPGLDEEERAAIEALARDHERAAARLTAEGAFPRNVTPPTIHR
jgi:MoxR-like ATPase